MATKQKTKPETEAAVEDPFLGGLNDAQRQAVVHTNGPLLIVAGAGTGKTTVITRRVSWLIASGRAKPEEVLALTFTDKAAGEMVERIDAQLPMGYVDLWVSTFHAFCQRMLQTHGLDIGLPNEFRLLSDTDAYLLVRKHFAKFDLDYYRPLGNPNKFIHALLKHFSRAKDEAVSPTDYLDHAQQVALDKDASGAGDQDDASRLTEIANAYHVYQRILHDEGCLDLGDLIVQTLRLFRERPAILEKYRKQFKYIIVDEFQDTNWSQYELLKLLAGKDGNIVVVGDDDQSIYKFRGASVSNILQFKGDFPTAKEVVLTENYRSTQDILDLAYSFIKKNDPNRLEFRLRESRKEGEPPITKRLVAKTEGKGEIAHLAFGTEDDEAAGVVGKILELREREKRDWSDFAVLVRSNAGADMFADEMERRGIPYQFLALKGLYAKPIVLDVLAYFRLLDDYHESTALFRVLSCPAYRIPPADLIVLTHGAKKAAQSLFATLANHALITELSPETRATADRLLRDLAKHTALAQEKRVSEVLVKMLYESGYAKLLREDDTHAARERVSHLKQFLDRIRRFETSHDDPRLAHFLEEFELERESGSTGGLKFDVETGPDMVRIMTIHASKGLEFPIVFLVNMVAQRFPSVNRGGEIELPDALTKEILPEGDIHLEEERRLCYVAVTRAKERLYFTSADDYGGKTKKKPSVFLAELGFADTAQLVVERAAFEEPARITETLPTYEPPPYFSFTQLAAYDTCPLQYKYAHVLRIPVLGNYQMSFGKTMHAVLERLLTEIAERTAVTQTDLFGGSATPTGIPVPLERVLAMYDEEWIDEWYPSAEEKEKYREEGRQALIRIHKEMTDHPPHPLFLEKDFMLKVGQFGIRGKIDRIDLVEGERGVEIVDYKTGKPKEKLESDDKRQLLLYQIAVGRLMGLEPKKLTFKYLRDGSEASFVGTEKEVGKFEAGLEEQMLKIRSADFTPTPGMHCKYCDFKEICDFSAA
jgi:DNA helicase II / ATP-dependent DNA helicase PcrA